MLRFRRDVPRSSSYKHALSDMNERERDWYFDYYLAFFFVIFNGEKKIGIREAHLCLKIHIFSCLLRVS